MNEYGKEVAKKMEDYMGDLESVTEEIKDIQNADEGIKVRGALAAGVAKSFNVSKNAEGKADEAHGVMESIINDGFDNAALEANFEQKLENEIANLQPEWTQFKDETTSQLAETRTNLSQNLSQGTKGGKGSITFILDDGRIEDYTIIKDIAISMKVHFSIAIITNLVGTSGYMTWAQIKELHDTGYFEILSHTHDHVNMTTVSETEMDRQARISKEILMQQGYDVRGFVYPFNARNDTTIKIVQKYYDFAFYRTNTTDELKNYPYIDNQMISRVSLGSYFDEGTIDGDTLSYYTSRVDEAEQYGLWTVFAVHPAVTNNTQIQFLKDTIDYAKGKNVDILTSLEGYNRHGNMIQTRGFSVDKNGNTFNSLNVEGLNAYKADDKYEKYPSNTVTTFPVNINGSDGFPGVGVVTVYKIGDQPAYTDMDFRTYDNTEIWTRKVGVDGEWGDFELTNSLLINRGRNKITANTPYSDFPRQSITIDYITKDNTSGFPGVGVAITHKYGDQPGYGSQDFRTYDNTEIWTRKVGVDGEWGNFERINTTLIAKEGVYTDSTPFADFPNNKITHFPVSSASAEGFPSLRGIATIYKMGGYGRAEFRAHEDAILWSKHPKPDGSWSEWYRP